MEVVLLANNAADAQQQFPAPVNGYDQKPDLPAIAPPPFLGLNPLNNLMNMNTWSAPLNMQQPPFQPREKLSKGQKRRAKHQRRALKLASE